jgi:hypothetical protein
MKVAGHVQHVPPITPPMIPPTLASAMIGYWYPLSSSDFRVIRRAVRRAGPNDAVREHYSTADFVCLILHGKHVQAAQGPVSVLDKCGFLVDTVPRCLRASKGHVPAT